MRAASPASWYPGTKPQLHVTSTGAFFEAMFRGQGRPGNTAGGAGNAFDSKKSTIFVKKIDFFHPTSYMYEPRGQVHEVGFLSFLKAGPAPIGLTPAPRVS